MPTGKASPYPTPVLYPPAWLPAFPSHALGRPGLCASGPDCSSQETSQGAGGPCQPYNFCPQHWKQPDAPEEKPRQPGADSEQGGASVWAGEQGRELEQGL